MLRIRLTAALALGVFLSTPIWAHHGHDHSAPPVPPPVAVPPPVVQIPVPVVRPPVVTFQLPVISPPTVILPTDTAGMHSGPDASKFQQLPSSPLTKEALAALTAPDSRYQFTGEWLPFSSQYSASVPGNSPYRPVALLSNDGSLKQGRLEHVEQPKPTASAFMPTTQASFTKVNDKHLALHSGAILVRTGNVPVFASTQVKGEKVLTRIAGGALAMVSAFDDKATVLNLTDKCCGALVMYMPSKDANRQHSVGIKPGQIAEVYAPDDKPVSNLVATKIDVNERIGHDYGLVVAQCHYVRALKKFNLTPVLAKQDLDRVLKTAAAIACVRR